MRELQLNFMLNKTTVRWLQMLNTFERERTCSIASLANKLDVTQRTISSDIKELKTYLQEAAEFTLEANGYHFRETDPKRYLSQKRSLLQKKACIKSWKPFSTGNSVRLKSGRSAYMYQKVRCVVI